MKNMMICAVLLLAGCAANAQPLAQTVPQSDVRALLPEHPLYGTLAQYDRQIAALRATLHTRDFAHVGTDMDASIAALHRDIAAAADAVNTLAARKADAYAAREDAAASAILADAGANANAPTQSDVRERLQRAYQAEYAQLRSGSDRDMETYRSALLAQQRAAYSAFVQSVQNRTQQAYAARAQELREQESGLLLDLARRHSAQRMQLRAKLQTLYLRPEERVKYRAQLQALQHDEDTRLSALRARDAQTLAQYRASLLARADTDVAKTSAELAARTAANLAERRDVLAAQQAMTASRLPVNASSPRASATPPVDLGARVAALRRNGRGDFQAAADATLTAYHSAEGGLAERLGTLREEDRASANATLRQISQLQRDREALYREILSQIAEAERRERARCGCADVTSAVRNDLQSLL